MLCSEVCGGHIVWLPGAAQKIDRSWIETAAQMPRAGLT